MRRATMLLSAALFVILCLAMMIDSTSSAAEQAPEEPVHITYTGLIFEPRQKSAVEEYRQRLLDEAYAGCEDTNPPSLCTREALEDEETERVFDGCLEDCVISHYCVERYAHICGDGQGITKSGREVEAGVSVAVDPRKIPLGSRVFIDYGDGTVHEYRADDTGNAVVGNHIDIAVETHDEALLLGLKTATVWWCAA